MNGKVGSILAIVAFIVVIAIGIWGVIAAVRLAPALFETIAGTFRGESSIELSSPADVRSGEPFVLSWADTERAGGLYTIRFGCTERLSMQAPTSPTEFGPMPCDTPYAIPAAESSVRLIPTLEGSERAEFPVTIAYLTPEGEKRSEGTATIVLVPTAQAAEPTQPAKPTTGQPPAPAKPAGKSDLSVRLIALGIVDPYTGQFIPKNVFGSYETVVARFDVANGGESASGSWNVATLLPTRVPTSYAAPVQSSIGPGAHTELILNFSQPMSGAIQISIDPENKINETNEGNNALTQYISVTY